ncbi:MAG: CARDB domain-containing protein, partial [Clostridium sp.]|nr:CARDB domain-containing protein [Clostridium sp.]
ATSSVKSGQYVLIVELNNVAQKVYLSIDSDLNPPSIELSISESASFTLGEVNPLTVFVNNTGDKAAKNIKVELLNDTDIAVVGSSNVKNIASLAAGSKTSYSSKIQLDSSTSSNLVRLKLGLSYSDASGENYTDTQYIYLNTNSINQTNDLSITNLVGPAGTYLPNANFNVKFNITSANGAEDVKITVKPADNIIPKTQSVFVLSELPKEQSKTYSVTFAATDQITTSTYPIEILLEYEYKGKSFSMSQYTSVSVYNEEDDDDKTSPKVILSECAATPQIVQAGEDVTLNFTFLNTHPSKSIYNLTATLDFNGENRESNNSTNSSASSSSSSSSSSNSTTSIFKTVSSSNTLFTSSLAPSASNSQNIIINTSASATAATYDVYVDLSYQDEDGNTITSTETIPITISQDINIDVAQIDLSTLSIGRSSALTATLYNISKSSISNVMMYLQSAALDTGFSVTDNKYYLSSFDLGGTEYYAPTLTGLAAGTYDVELVIEYEDCLGNAQMMTYPFQVEVAGSGNMKASGNGNTPEGMPQMGQGKGGNVPGGEQTSSSTNPWLIGGIVIGLVAAAFVIYRIIRKKKQSKDFKINE